ncbi:hypothetical protein [Polyangium sp. 15x6]|uniref:DUF6891 domain-containing protein n=1 Tax=Polyangium sp. 15x6 TaxID=3042687 RepID=UPI00249C2CC0|nr:hypothetical protein [Polyangium sp. 15x6]MDI3287770.1 hypothetical protein [Polyangium sp. 15x6]
MPTEEAIAQCREWLERVVDVDCRAGVYDEANILEALEEIIEVELGEPFPALFEEFAARVKVGLEARAREEATWGDRTINDRLDSAFDDLDARGIVTAQALGSTLQEGAELIDAMSGDREARGSAFYHRQDLERALEGGGLRLAFTAYGDEAGGGEAIGREIVHVLKHHGVPVSWGGDVRSRIEIEPFEWRKRRATKAPPGGTAAPPVLPPAPPPRPAVCEICKGRGWIQTDPTRFPDICVCKGGKPSAGGR